MGSASVDRAESPRIGERLLACVAAHGSAAHPYHSSDTLLRGADASRNLSDAVHFLCMLHGRQPGVVDHAAQRCLEPEAAAWFASATSGFAAERGFLTRLAVAAGPIPSTPGSAGSEAAVMGQRHAIEMLAQSERQGCALGAALAVVLDWHAIRSVLDIAAERFGITTPGYQLDECEALRAVAEGLCPTPSVERALLFGAEQIVVQHFGLWDLLEVRQQARAGI